MIFLVQIDVMWCEKTGFVSLCSCCVLQAFCKWCFCDVDVMWYASVKHTVRKSHVRFLFCLARLSRLQFCFCSCLNTSKRQFVNISWLLMGCMHLGLSNMTSVCFYTTGYAKNGKTIYFGTRLELSTIHEVDTILTSSQTGRCGRGAALKETT